jgi:hypothetical protein
MLMVLPLLSPSEIDYSANYTLREAFWFGISSCRDPSGFFCNPNMDPKITLVTDEGWKEILRGIVKSSENQDEFRQKELLWMYLPNWANGGAIETIPSIEKYEEDIEKGLYWEQTKECAGFIVSDDCPWRYEEMSLIGYTP